MFAKHKSHLSPESGKRYNHNTEAIQWLFLLSQDLVEMWKHIVFILGEKNLQTRAVCTALLLWGQRGADLDPGIGEQSTVWVSGHTEPGAPPGPRSHYNLIEQQN